MANSYTPPVRNFDRVQFETYRKKVDSKFNTLHDELSDCYYNFWKHGNSKPFNAGSKTYDVQETPEESKVLFDKLHGLIFHLHEQAIEQEHLSTPKGKQDSKFESRVMQFEGRDQKVQERVQRILDFKNQGIEITR